MRRARVRRLIVGLAIALVALAGCDPEGPGRNQPEKPPAAGQAKNQNDRPHLPEVDRPGPQADPGSCVEGGARSIELYAHWLSETATNPSIKWSHNGKSTPASNVQSHRVNNTRFWGGEWSIMVVAKCHDTLEVELKGTSSALATACSIIDLGDGPVKTGERNCKATYTVP
jgi:hypothetical protein